MDAHMLSCEQSVLWNPADRGAKHTRERGSLPIPGQTRQAQPARTLVIVTLPEPLRWYESVL